MQQIQDSIRRDSTCRLNVRSRPSVHYRPHDRVVIRRISGCVLRLLTSVHKRHRWRKKRQIGIGSDGMRCVPLLDPHRFANHSIIEFNCRQKARNLISPLFMVSSADGRDNTTCGRGIFAPVWPRKTVISYNQMLYNVLHYRKRYAACPCCL